MDLVQNPFYILNASPRDNRRRILELADERSLLLDSCDCMEARSVLTSPRKRLSAEVAWLPGIGLKRAGEVLSLLESSPEALLTVENLPPIARTNLLAAGLARLPNYSIHNVSEWILEISWAFEDIDGSKLSMIINEERVVSGFPEVSDISAIEAEIQDRRRYYAHVIKLALDNLSSKELVEAVTVTVESATDNGEEPSPVIIADLVDSYEVEAQFFFEKEERNIRDLVEKLRASLDAKWPDSTLASMVKQLIQVVKNWDTVAQPIQVSAKSRGIDHEASLRIANMVRDLAIYMFNEHGKLDFSQQLTNMLQEVFAEVGKVAERTAEDADILDEIAERRLSLMTEVKNKTENWRKEITYETEIGIIFKDKLRISPEGIEWKGHCWNLNSISRLRWGGIQYTAGGIPTRTFYSIGFGNDSDYTHIKLRKKSIYDNFVERLWKAVGVRLLMEYLEGLRDGKKYCFGSTVISDYGVELERKKFLGNNERVFCSWGEVWIWNIAGFFCIGKKEDSKLDAAFSYQDEDNIHILEVAIRMFLEKGGDRLSCLLEE